MENTIAWVGVGDEQAQWASLTVTNNIAYFYPVFSHKNETFYDTDF